MNTAPTPQTFVTPPQRGNAALRQGNDEAFERAAAELRPSWAHLTRPSLPSASTGTFAPSHAPARAARASTEGLASHHASFDFSPFDMATRDALEAERYRSALQRDFLLQKPRLVRWLAVLALTGVGLLWALSSSAAAPHAARSTPSATSARGSSGDSTEFAPH